MSLCQKWGPPGSPTIASHFIRMATDSASWHCYTLCQYVNLNLFGSWSRFFIHHSNNPPLQFFINFSLTTVIWLAPVPWAVNFLMTLCTVDTGTSRSLEMTCSLEIVHAFPQFWFSNPQTVLCSYFFSPRSVWYTQTHNTKVELTFLNLNWLQVWFLYYQHLLLATGEFKYKLKEHHMLEIQLWKGASHFSSPYLELCVEW